MKKTRDGHLEPAFVRETYNTLLKNLPTSYTAYRWEATPVSRFHYEQSRRALERVLQFVPARAERALEVGGGDGAWTPFFASRAERLDFVDISDEMLKEAAHNLAQFSHITYIQSDFALWPGEKGVYEVAASFRNLEYMADKERAVAKFEEVLTPRGVLVLSTKSPEYDWGGYFNKRALHQGQISISRLLSLLRQHNFKVVAVYPAIIGKKTRHKLVRALWHGVQTVLLYVPRPLMPLFLLKYIAESFIVCAQKK